MPINGFPQPSHSRLATLITLYFTRTALRTKNNAVAPINAPTPIYIRLLLC